MSDELAKTENGKPIEVDVGIMEVIPTDDEALAAMKRLGFITMGPGVLRDLRAMGLYVKGVGVRHIERGRTLISQQRMDLTMRKITELIEQVADSPMKPAAKIKHLATLANSLATCMGKLTESQKFQADNERMSAARPIGAIPQAEAGEPVNQAFMPGQDVRPGGTMVVAREVHMHAAPANRQKPNLPP